MGDDIFCLAVFRPDDIFMTPLSVSLANSYAESILNDNKTWATAGVERSDEERGGAFKED